MNVYKAEEEQGGVHLTDTIIVFKNVSITEVLVGNGKERIFQWADGLRDKYWVCSIKEVLSKPKYQETKQNCSYRGNDTSNVSSNS
mmetsp:Transcript_16095/g.16695  ORF Transcript_16095/g.16695 Transcript_16095/m.16695 type:complete len:86 (+) Transcript_16095:175-432(+)